MNVLINAVSAKLGGAATYIQNLAHSVAKQARPEEKFLFVVPPDRVEAVTVSDARVRVVASSAAHGSYVRRTWWDQISLRSLANQERPDVLFSSANFAMLSCPCPQVLLVRIPIYFAKEYLDHVLPTKSPVFRAETRLRRWLVCQSVRAADCVMTPTAAMMEDLRRFVRLNGVRTVVNPYGVPRARVTLPPLEPPADPVGRPLRLLWVSHYADHKNLLTLLLAVDQLRREGRAGFELLLTLDASADSGQHTAMPTEERDLLRKLSSWVKPIGVQSYDATWKLYAETDIFVFPSLAESFGHPLVEAMACGLPIVASDIPVHREICGPAAAYFPVLSSAALAGVLRSLLRDPSARASLAAQGRMRVQKFLWEDHVARLLARLREVAVTSRRRAVQALAASS